MKLPKYPFSILVPLPLVLILATVVLSASGKKEIYKQGLNAQAEENYEKAVQLFQRSLDEEGETPECLANLGLSLSYISKNYANKAYTTYMKALKSAPNHEETLGYLGEIYLLQGNLLKANDILKKLKKLESDEAETLEEKMKQIMGQLERIKRDKGK